MHTHVHTHVHTCTQHFRALLFGGMREAHGAPGAQIEVPDVGYDVFLKMLEFLYTDSVSDITPQVAVPLLIASERYDKSPLILKA